jgi:L-fuculose-phosphate aldolase
MVKAGRLLWERDLLGAAEGNLSCRLGDHILCTPSGRSKGHLEERDLVMIDLDGNPLQGGVPSSEIKVHLRLYRLRSDVQAVVHAHPITATAFATCGQTVPSEYLHEAVVILGDVALVPFAMPGTESLPDALEPFARNHQTFLLANHGSVAVGQTVMEAAYRMETLERVARIVLAAQQIGAPNPLPESVIAGLRNYGQDTE